MVAKPDRFFYGQLIPRKGHSMTNFSINLSDDLNLVSKQLSRLALIGVRNWLRKTDTVDTHLLINSWYAGPYDRTEKVVTDFNFNGLDLDCFVASNSPYAKEMDHKKAYAAMGVWEAFNRLDSRRFTRIIPDKDTPPLQWYEYNPSSKWNKRYSAGTFRKQIPQRPRSL